MTASMTGGTVSINGGPPLRATLTVEQDFIDVPAVRRDRHTGIGSRAALRVGARPYLVDHPLRRPRTGR